MISSPIRTNPSRTSGVFRKICPVVHIAKPQRTGPGSGSLGEFIEKITPIVVISRLPSHVKERMPLNKNFLMFLQHFLFTFLFFAERTACSPAPFPFYGNLPHTGSDNSSSDSLSADIPALLPPGQSLPEVPPALRRPPLASRPPRLTAP